MNLRKLVTFACAAMLLLAAGCDRSDLQSFSSETDEPNFRQGQQLVKQGRSQEALASYLKVIAKRGEAAPESHLEVGLLYLQHIKDPLAAIYHFRKYLELQPNSRQAVYVNGLVEAARRDYARQLPAQPMESQAGLDLLDRLDRLQRENDDLRSELATLRGGATVPMIRTRGPLDEDNSTSRPAERPSLDASPTITWQAPSPSSASPVESAPAEEDSPVTLASDAPSQSYAPVRAAPTPPTATPTRSVPTKPTAPATSGGRKHTVAKGDTLFSLAQKYYGNRSKWRDIYNANRDQLPSENSLRLGMELKIP